jgi:cytochrome b561
MAVVTVAYVAAYRQAGELPAAAGLLGHGLGVVGIVMMLMTETLYSIRKRVADARWGCAASWLRFHIFTGLVGPYLVLLHTAMAFRGLAGVSLLMTAVVVASGVVGRYVYTNVPRAVAAPGVVAAAVAAPAMAASSAMTPVRVVGPATTAPPARTALTYWRSIHVPLTWVLFGTAFIHAAAALFYATLQR